MVVTVIDSELDLQRLKEDVEQSADIINSDSNQYDIIFQSKLLNKLESSFTSILTKLTQENFDVYVKRFQAYIQTEMSSEGIRLERELKRGLKPLPKYSFILFIEGKQTKLVFNSASIVPRDGELVVFKTEDFIKEECTNYNRVGILGSLTNNISTNTSQILI